MARAAKVPKEERRCPVQGGWGYYRRGSIPWRVAEIVWREYDRNGHGAQTLERIAERGGFGWSEIGQLLTNAIERGELIVKEAE